MENEWSNIHECLPGIYSEEELNELSSYAKECLRSIENSASLRQIVIETWLLSDWLIRSVIASAFDLSRYSVPDFDLKNKLLPQSFEKCCDILEKLIKIQKALPAKVTHNSCTAPHISSNSDGWKFVNELCPDFDKKFEEKFGKCTCTHKFLVKKEIKQHRTVSDEWLVSIDQIDDDWFKSVRKLNMSRNAAAHTFDDLAILKPWGIPITRNTNKKSSIDKIKKQCKEILEKLMIVKL